MTSLTETREPPHRGGRGAHLTSPGVGNSWAAWRKLAAEPKKVVKAVHHALASKR